jgi:hypothetical protein
MKCKSFIFVSRLIIRLKLFLNTSGATFYNTTWTEVIDGELCLINNFTVIWSDGQGITIVDI